MKKIFALLSSLLVMSMIFSFESCKKKDEEQIDQPPANQYRLLRQDATFYYDTANTVLEFAYQDEKIINHTYYLDNELHTKHDYVYELRSEESIFRYDTNYYNYGDTIHSLMVAFLVQNNLIVESTTQDDDFLVSAEYRYEGQNLIYWEYINVPGSPIAKGEYVYNGDNMVSYAYYIANNEGGWHLSSKTEYTYQDGKRHEILYFIRFDEINEPDLVMKRQFQYEGELPNTIELYYRTLEDEWRIAYVTYLSYDSNGNLVEVKDYATDGINEIIDMEIKYTWEPGGSNADMFYKIQTTLPLSDQGYPIWGFDAHRSVDTRMQSIMKYGVD
jgi:hypothetical protein